MEEILRQLRLVAYPIIHLQGLYIPGGAGFQPSTVVHDKFSSTIL